MATLCQVCKKPLTGLYCTANTCKECCKDGKCPLNDNCLSKKLEVARSIRIGLKDIKLLESFQKEGTCYEKSKALKEAYAWLQPRVRTLKILGFIEIFKTEKRRGKFICRIYRTTEQGKLLIKAFAHLSRRIPTNAESNTY